MHRRELLKLAGAALALPAACRTAAAAEPPKWKTAVGLNGFMSSSKKYGKTYPIWEVLDFASQAGFDGVELVRDWPMGGYPAADQADRIRALRRLYDAFGLQVFSLQTTARDAFSPDPGVRADWLAEFGDWARFAKAVGCDAIGMWPGGPLDGQTIDEAIERLAASFAEAARIAAGLGLAAAFEIEPPFVFNTEEHMARILHGALSKQAPLKIIYDPSHFDLMNGSTGRPHEMLRRIGVENVGYVQFTDGDGTLRDGGTSKHLACGDGHIDVEASFRTLWEGGFRGWMMIDAWQIPDPYDACTKGKQAIGRFLSGR
jgi:sugar phosphate isomerase/epimerase